MAVSYCPGRYLLKCKTPNRILPSPVPSLSASARRNLYSSFAAHPGNMNPNPNPNPPSSSSSSKWGRGGTLTDSSKRGRGGGGRGGGRGAYPSSQFGGSHNHSANSRFPSHTGSSRHASTTSTATAAAMNHVLPTQPLPYCSLYNINEYYQALIESGRVKLQYLENPKNPVANFVLHQTGSYPIYSFEEGQVDGRRDKNFRCTVVLDRQNNWTVYGDAKTTKEAEKAAAVHAVLFLQDRELLSKPPTSAAATAAASVAAASSSNPVIKLDDGTELTPIRAREFMDFYCKRFGYDKPDIHCEPGKVYRGNRTVQSGWSAVMTVNGMQAGTGSASNKKVAIANCYLDSVSNVQSQDASLWKLFNTTYKAGAPIGKAPHVFFTLSEELHDQATSIYELTKQSKIFAKRPKTTSFIQPGQPIPSANEARNPKQQHQQQQQQQQNRRSAKFNQQFRVSKEVLEQKSQQLIQRLQDYQSDDSVKALRQQRQSLPVMQEQSNILTKILCNQVTICMAATGSGKTTQIPQLLFEDCILQGQGAECNIICTQPRRIAAISVAERVAKERGEALGQTVGYQVRFDAKLPQPNGSITFCTTGIFLRRLQSALGDADSTNGFLDSITHVIIDEVHERDVETDLLLVVIKRLLNERKRLGKKEIKVILMSATIDPTLFQTYFADNLGRPAPVVQVPGRSFPVEKHFLGETIRSLEALQLVPDVGGWVWGEKNVRDYLDRELNMAAPRHHHPYHHHQSQQQQLGADPSVDNLAEQTDDLELPFPLIALMIAYVMATSQDGHALVFLPGWDEIKVVHQILQDTRQCPLMGLDFCNRDLFEIHVLHSSVPVQDQQAVFEPVRRPGIRRIILATNIAETSITIPDVVYVVDTGRVKEKRFDPQRHLSSLVSAWVGTSNLNQRAGRAGRHRAGEYYGVLSKTRYDRLNVHQTVEMKRVDLSNVVMHIKALDIPGMEVEDVLQAAIEPPAPERVLAAMESLRTVGALDINNNLTSLGRVLLQLPVDAQIGKMCLYGAFFRCLDPVLTLAAILTNRDPFIAPVHLKREVDAVKDFWCPADFRSDALTVLRAYTQWWELKSRGDVTAANRFCSDNFLSKITLSQIQQVKEHLFQSMEKADIIQVIQRSSLTSNVDSGNDNHGGTGSRYRPRPRETDSEFNLNMDSTPLLAALVAVSSAPNFAIRSSEKTYRTSQDKTCFMHPSSVCHLKYTKHKQDDVTQPGEKELYAFSEKIRNVSNVTSHGTSNALTMLRGCTRLDPLTYMLFGAYDVRVTGQGVECDAWLPVMGNYEALDDLERLKGIMDVVMLRVFEGIGKQPNRSRTNGNNYRFQNSWDEVEAAQDEGGEDEDLDGGDRSLTPQEIREFQEMTLGIVKLLDGYAQERAGIAASRGSTRPGSPGNPTSGYVTPSSIALTYPTNGGGQGWTPTTGSAPGSQYGGGNPGSRWNSRPQSPASGNWRK